MPHFRFIDPPPATAEVFEDIKFVREDDDKPRCSARIWIGRSQKPTYNYSFRSPERREEFIAECKTSATSRVKRQAERKAEIAASRKRQADPAKLIREAKDGQRFSGAETAALVRYRLAKVFPGVKFSVRSDSSINIEWTLGPTTEEVDKVTDIYGGQGFDGMIDMRYYYDAWLLPDGSAVVAHTSGTTGSAGTVSPFDRARPEGAVKVHFGTDFVFHRRNIPDELYERIGRDLCALQRRPYVGPNQRDLMGDNDHQYLNGHVGELLGKTSFPPGTEYAGVEYSSESVHHVHWVRAILKPVEQREAVAA